MIEARKGDLFILISILLWSSFAVITKLSFQILPFLWSASLSILIATIFFFYREKKSALIQHNAWKDIWGTTILIGILYYGLFFYGLQYTSAGNAGVLGLTEIFFAYLFFIVLAKKEAWVPSHALGATLMIIGAICVLAPNQWTSQWGDLIIILATIFSVWGNAYMKNARTKVSSDVIMFWRSLISGLFLLGLAFHVSPPFPALETLTEALPILLVNGLLLMGLSKIFWIEGIHRIPISRAMSIAPLGAAFTLLLAFFFLGEIPTSYQLLGLVPISAGVWLLVKK